MCQSKEFVADFLEDPVPTTSPTNTIGLPIFLRSVIISRGFSMPSLGILNIAFACNGISGLDHASCAGDKSSVFISPATLKTVNLISFSRPGLSKNHVPSAQL